MIKGHVDVLILRVQLVLAQKVGDQKAVPWNEMTTVEAGQGYIDAMLYRDVTFQCKSRQDSVRCSTGLPPASVFHLGGVVVPIERV
jgi:hypothetical protein